MYKIFCAILKQPVKYDKFGNKIDHFREVEIQIVKLNAKIDNIKPDINVTNINTANNNGSVIDNVSQLLQEIERLRTGCENRGRLSN